MERKETTIPPPVAARFFGKPEQGQSLLIKNVRVYGYNGSEGEVKNICVDEHGKLAMLTETEASKFSSRSSVKTWDAESEFALMPGWLDSHVHGYGGADFADANKENLKGITQALGASGLSYCMATLVSLELSKLKKSLAAIDAYVLDEQKKPTPGLTQIVGVHLEGPYIAQNCKGAHDEIALQHKIDIETFKEMVRAAPHISQWKMTLAPDLEGAIEFIKQVQDLSVDGRKIAVKVFIGHTNAEEKLIDAAVAAGAKGFTHLGNANREEAQRCCGSGAYHSEEQIVAVDKLKSNVVKWVVKNAKKHDIYVELIVDGEHLSRGFVDLMREKIGDDKILQITDALGPSGLADGEYELGTLKVLKRGEKFVLKTDSNKLAGSAATFAKVVKKYSDWSAQSGDGLYPMIYASSVLNPRRSSLDSSFKLPDESNFVLVDKQGNLVMSACNGKLAQYEPNNTPQYCSNNTPVGSEFR